MPDATGRFRGISVPELPWLRKPAPDNVLTREELEQQDWGAHDDARLRLLESTR